jgi:hypothetical protein
MQQPSRSRHRLVQSVGWLAWSASKEYSAVSRLSSAVGRLDRQRVPEIGGSSRQKVPKFGGSSR